MASMGNSSNMTTEHEEGNESITDIQNYLQSFNKEIGEDTNHQSSTQNATYYAIDTSQVIATGASSSDGAQVAVTQNTAGGDANGYQTLALVPDGNSGGYVLIVQPTTGQQGQAQVQMPATIAGQAIVTSGSQTIALSEGISVPTNLGQSNVTVSICSDGKIVATPNVQNGSTLKVEDEEEEEDEEDEEDEDEDGHNDISVYDFEEGHATTSGGAIAIPEVINETEMNQSGELSDKNMKGVKRAKKAQPGSAKKIRNVGSSPTSSSHHMCNYCNYTSGKRYLLSRHMKSHSEERPHKCGICERGFKTVASLNNHVNTHTGVKPHSCKYCDSAFTTSGELVRHVRYRHTHEKPHRCSECDYASVELSKLKRHMRCHTGERPYQCQHCTYASPDTYKLKRHLRIHTGEKPYECEVCHARFTQSNSLKAHRLIHSGNKPIFKCDLCPTTCGRKTDLRIHVQKLHTSEKPLSCKRCEQAFPDRYSFKIHLKSHEGEKCFKCDLCNYASVSARHLESHMLIHTDQKPFLCDECDQSFRQKQLLKRHKNLYHNPEYIPPQPKEKTHECPNCSKAFRHKGNLMRHLSLHDPDAYKDASMSIRSNENHQLIDDEEDEDTMLPSLSFSNDETTMDPQLLHLTFDPQQQMVNGEQVVVFEVVQVNNTENSSSANEEQQFATIDGEQVAISAAKPKNILTGKQNIKAVRIENSSLRDSNYIIQLQTEEEEAVNRIEEDNTIIDEAEYESLESKQVKTYTEDNTLQVTTIHQPPPPMVVEEKVQREQIQKQKDFSDCFGFKDDDDEDEAILSMPAAHAQ